MKRYAYVENPLKNQRGLTLMELMASLAIAALLGLGTFQMITLFFNDWNHADASQTAILQSNDTITLISRDIRSAEKPNNTTNAVRVIDASTLDIYQYNNGNYQRTEYRLHKNNITDTFSVLQRGSFETTVPDTSLNPQYGTITNWRNMLSGIADANTSIFTDVTPIADSERRSIRVNLTVSDTQHNPSLFTPLTTASTFMSRSQQIGALSGGGGGSYIAVNGISLTPYTLSFVSGIPASTHLVPKTVTVTVYPDNASNHAVICTPDQPNWIGYTVNNNVITITLQNNNGNARNGTLTVKTDDGGWTAIVSISQNAKNH